MPRLILTLAAVLMTTAAVAQDAPAFDALSACRMDAARAEVSFSFQGSPCIAAGDAEVTDAGEHGLDVRVPFEATSEVCTMNIVPVEVTQTIGVSADTAKLTVTAADLDGNILARGEATLSDKPDCKEKTTS